MSRRRRAAVILLGLLTALGAASPRVRAGDAEVTTQAMDKVTPGEFRGDLRDLPQIHGPSAPPQPRPYRPRLGPPLEPVPPAPEILMPELELAAPAPLAPMPSPTQNFPGLSHNDSCGGVPCGTGWPPDTNGDVGPNHYIQAVNTAYAIFSKTGTPLVRITEDQLWAGQATPCNGNSQGDPVVLYDQLADRWILTHFAFADVFNGPYYQCFAVSITGDPVSGGWRFYQVRMDPGGAGPPVGTLNDYGKFGIWPDCLYMSANGFVSAASFTGVVFASFSRADMYSGAALTSSIGFIADPSGPYTMLPSNLLGKAASAQPPAGTPNYYVSEKQNSTGIEVRKFTAGPNCGAGGTLSAATVVSQTAYTASPYGNAVPQPGTAILLDSLDDIMMQKAQYRRVGATESLWVVHSVRTSASSTVRPHWVQINVTGGVINTTPVQQQIYAPDTTLHRWMGSLAVDNQGNMALGYSTSNGTSPNFPSIAYSGRLAGDPAGTLPQSETVLIAGTASQTNSCGGGPCHRWGDYSAMSVDPVDDCTFWYTNEYYVSGDPTGNWRTRIGSFKFPSCVAPSGATLTESPGTVVAGGSVNATWSGITSPTTTDWIGLFVPGSANTAYLAWIYVSCTQTPGGAMAAGSCSFPIPAGLTPGAYELRLMANNGYTLLATSVTFTVTAAGPTLSESPGSVAAGNSVTATWSGIASPSATDWIGLYAPASANTSYLAWEYVSCSQAPGSPMASGSCSFPIPGGLTPGTYQLRLLSNNSYTALATSSNFTVNAAGPTLAVSPTSVPAGGSVTATWSGIASPTTTDWIALYMPGAPNTSYLAWEYVSCSQAPGGAMAAGSCAFTIPSGVTPGTYELRLLSNNGYTALATSNALTVGAAGPGLKTSPTTVVRGASVTATWSGIPSPTTTDWIGLFVPGSANTAYLAWIYVSCSQAPGGAAAGGSCPFTIPGGVTPGTYELRLFTNNGYTRLATGNPFTVN